LTPTPATGSTFTGSRSSDSSGTSLRAALPISATTVTATFDVPSFALTVTNAGTGTGTVTSAPAGITCGTSCSASYPSGTAVTLTATPGTRSTFTGLGSSGAAGSFSCTVTMTAA